MVDTLGLLAEARQIAIDLGYAVREEPLGELPGGRCVVGGERRILLNLEHTATAQLEVLVAALASDPRTHSQPMSRLLAARLGA
ncbi:MAG: hypothetical protein EBR28_14145 [Planctomycetia bacterium]|nr:hypothetical protein [Planctomycetia bacterium]